MAWVAMECTARCLGDLKEDYQNAITFILKAVDVMPQNLKANGIDSYLLGYCSGWKQSLGDNEGALELGKK